MRPILQPLLLLAPILCLANVSGCRTHAQPIKRNPIPATITQPAISKEPNTRLTPVLQSTFEETQTHLQQIELLIADGNDNAAKTGADNINPKNLTPLQQAQLNLLYAQILLNFGEAEQAIEKLALIQTIQLPQKDQIKYFQSQAFAFALSGNLLESAKSRIELHHLLSETESAKNQTAIIETLSLLSEPSLQYAQTNTQAGWISLAKLSKSINLPGFSDQLLQWRAAFPEHPANPALLTQAQEAPNTLTQSESIAIFLPESGPFNQAGNAVRAGFMAAYNHAKKPSNLKFYDTSQESLINHYNQAIKNGATFIIGPLDKESIQNLANSTALSIPVLALNHIEGLQKENLYQFALSPIDDAEQITNKLGEDGHLSVLTLIPDNTSGQRVNNYFRENLDKLSGNILESQSYNTKITDFSIPIEKLLNIDESDLRYQKILKTIPSAKYSPRRRQDAQAILLSARSSEASSINLQLKLYQSNDLPVYSMPSIYTGIPNPSQDSDLNGIYFCDIPWILKTSNFGEMNIQALKESWQQLPKEYLKLFAMGIDAFNLTSRLSTMQNNSYSGTTGLLSLTSENRIKRSLPCALFINGLPEIVNSTRKNQ